MIIIDPKNKKLAEVFSDAENHVKISNIINHHKTNPLDIREEALKNLDFSGVAEIFDLGCGFGFFTKALYGKVNPGVSITGIDCHPQYRNLYLKSCEQAGINGQFIGEDTTTLQQIQSNTVDLILCSYALYFFPEIIPHISRILNKNGMFIVITHSRLLLREIGLNIKKALLESHENFKGNLPYERLVNNFSGENGEQKLKPYFGKIQKGNFGNSLEFNRVNLVDLETYLRYKSSFFLSGDKTGDYDPITVTLKTFEKQCMNAGHIEISKNDVIFVCSKPLIN